MFLSLENWTLGHFWGLCINGVLKRGCDWARAFFSPTVTNISIADYSCSVKVLLIADLTTKHPQVPKTGQFSFNIFFACVNFPILQGNCNSHFLVTNFSLAEWGRCLLFVVIVVSGFVFNSHFRRWVLSGIHYILSNCLVS